MSYQSGRVTDPEGVTNQEEKLLCTCAIGINSDMDTEGKTIAMFNLSAFAKIIQFREPHFSCQEVHV